ncbi:CDC45 family [Aspergillus nidulans var. acristatus]
MYLPRHLISHLYLQLLRSHHPLSPPVLILAALEPDALCACRILTALLKRDYIPHKIHPVSGYGDLARAGEELVRPMQTSNGGSGGVVVCLGVGGLVDLAEILGLNGGEDQEGADDMGGVEVWVFDAKRPWNLANVFGGGGEGTQQQDSARRTPGVDKGCITVSYKFGSGKGGVVVYDDGDIEEEMEKEREAYCALLEMPEVDDDDGDDEDEDDEPPSSTDSKKRKSWSREDDEDEDFDEDDGPPRQRRRSNSGSSIASSPTRTRARTRHDSSNTSRSVTPASDSPSPAQPKEPSARSLRRRLLRLKHKHESILHQYYSSGTSYSEPISSIMYSLASELGREDNDLLWLAIVGVCSLELSGRTMSGVGVSSSSESGGLAGWGGERGERIRQILRDEVHRLNPPDPNGDIRGEIAGVIPTTARSPTDKSIRLSPEPRFILVRHWSLYESMLHSPYLASRLHVWTENGRKRLHKLLAKMGISLTQCHQNYTHMDMELKRVLRQRLLKYAPMYGLDGLVPPEAPGHAVSREGWGFVRCWGWKACLSATDVGVIVGAILEVGPEEVPGAWDAKRIPRLRRIEGSSGSDEANADPANLLSRFWTAYDALSLTSESPTLLLEALPLAQHLHRAILRTGTSLLSKHQIRHLRAFRIAVVKDGPDVKLFTNPGALTKLALWVAEAIRVQERDRGDAIKIGKRRAAGTPLVLAGLDEDRGLYVVVGTGGGGGVIDFAAMHKRREERRKKREIKEKKRKEKEEAKAKRAAERAARADDGEEDEEEESEEESSSSESESDSEGEQDMRGNKHLLRNRFGIAFQEVVQETNTRVRIDSFEHCVVEVQKDDLGGFLEALSFRSVVG